MIIVTHTDMDGICSAALFILKYGTDIEIKYVTVNEAKQLHREGFKPDYTCDLPKIDDSINIDHHKSNFEELIKEKRLLETDVVKPEAASATDLVFKTLELESNTTAVQIKRLGHLADTAQLPDEYKPLDIVLNLNSDNPHFLRQISENLAKMGKNILGSQWLEDNFVALKETYTRTQEVIQNFLKRTKSFPQILILDTRGAIPPKLAKEVFKPLFNLNISVIALIYQKSEKEKLRVSLRVKKDKQDIYDVSKVARALNGGGHIMAAACNPDPKKFPNNLIKELKKIACQKDEISILHLGYS
ncbi:MAG: DHHA1 domain-containing protein [Candidatus Hodarchaeales archaeon]